MSHFMRSVVWCFFLLSGISLRAAERDSIPWNSIVDKMQRYYNRETSDSFITMLSSSFLQAVPPGKFAETHKMLKSQLGNWRSTERFSVVQQKGKFIVQADNARLFMDVYTDSSGQLTGFFFSPYVEPRKKEEIRFASNPMRNSLDSLADRQLRAYLQIAGTAGVSAAFVNGGEVSYYNYGETGNKEQPFPDSLTLYEIGSVTKTFTASLLAQMVLSGKMKLEDPVNKYLPDSIKQQGYNGKPVTVLSLSNHSSGYPEIPDLMAIPGFNQKDPFAHYNRSYFMAFLNKYDLPREAGAKFQYSNLAVGLLGVLLENVSGKTYEKLLKTNVCSPLSMQYTTISVDEKARSILASGHDDAGNATAAWHLGPFSAAGAIRSNTLDLVKYVKAQWDETSPLKEAIALTHRQTSAEPAIGLGWFLGKTPGGDTLISHNGKTGGFGSYILIHPAKKKAVIFLFNSTAGSSNGIWLQPLLDSFILN